MQVIKADHFFPPGLDILDATGNRISQGSGQLDDIEVGNPPSTCLQRDSHVVSRAASSIDTFGNQGVNLAISSEQEWGQV